jgi:ankyrin repeat protein
LPLPPPNRLVIETRGPDGEWSTYNGKSISAVTNPHAILQPVQQPFSPPTCVGNNPFMGSLGNGSLLSSPTFSPYVNATFEPGDSSPQVLTNSRERREVFLNSRQSPQYTPSIDGFHGPTADNASEELWNTVSASHDSNFLLQCLDDTFFHEYHTVLLQGVTLERKSMFKKAQRLPDAEDVLDSLISLLPESSQQQSFEQTSEISTKATMSDSPFRSALLFSIANGFAGLRNIPPGVILGFLRKDDQMTSHILECFKSDPSSQAKSLGDNLFRAAIEACDEDAVQLIFQATEGSSNAIDPNQIVCKINGNDRLYTPIELAAKLRHLGIVNILLKKKADVNKTYVESKKQDRHEYGALELAIRMRGEFEEVDINLVQAILASGAEVRGSLIMAAIRWGQVDVIYKLIDRIPPAAPGQCSDSYSIMEEAARYLENKVATQVIKRVFHKRTCAESYCAHEYHMNQTLLNAARRGNYELVKWFLPFNTDKDGVLAAAIRSRNQEMIEHLLLHGISMVEGSMHLDDLEETSERSYQEFPTTIIPKTTALAEAIRSHDKNLVQRIEQLGALSYINDNDTDKHFEAALCAAAEIGDTDYIQMLLRRAPKKRGECLMDALIVAIRNDKAHAALVLLDNEAAVIKKDRRDEECAPLREALYKKNRAVMEEILEHGVGFNVHKTYGDSSPMELAGRWGDLSVAKSLIFMGFGKATIALSAAVESRNNDLIQLLLERGADPSGPDNDRRTPLRAAIENDDSSTIELLISWGANPADEGALLVAVEKNQKIFNKLLKLFSIRYPFGKEGFGSSLLIEAIKKADTMLLDSMMDAKFDLEDFREIRHNFQLETCVSVLGFAIIHTKRTDGDLSLLERLLGTDRLDPNRPVRKPDPNSVCHLETPLMVAIETRSESVVELLLEKGADIHQPAKRGINRTALQRACEIGSFKMVNLLLSKGAKVDEQPGYNGGATALQLAARSGSIKIAELLLSQGARVHEAPARLNGKTAFEGAAEHGCLGMLKFLWDAATAVGTPFTPEQIEKAKPLALANSHRGCVEYIQECLQSLRGNEPEGSGDNMEVDCEPTQGVGLVPVELDYHFGDSEDSEGCDVFFDD